MPKPNFMRPVTSVDIEERHRFFADYSSAPTGVLTRMQEELDGLHTRFEAGPDDIDQNNVYAGTAEEKVASAVTNHTRLAAVNDLLKAREEETQAAAIANGEGPQGSEGEQTIRDLVEASVQQRLEAMGQGEPAGLAADFRAAVAAYNEANEATAIPEFGEDFIMDARQSKRVLAVKYNPRQILGRSAGATFSRTDGYPPFSVRDPGYVEARWRPPNFWDLLPKTTIRPGRDKAIFLVETLKDEGGKAAATAEDSPFPESDLDMSNTEVDVRDIGTHVPVTKQTMEDGDLVDSYLNMRVPALVIQRSDDLSLTGSGTAPAPQGLLNVSGLQDQNWKASRADPWDTLRFARTKVLTPGRSMPTDYVFHPTVWDVVVTAKNNNGYYAGSAVTGFEERAHGLPVVFSEVLDATTGKGKVNAICGSFLPMWIEARIAREIMIEWGFIDDDFTRNRMRILATIRWALCVYRPPAFVTISNA